MSHALRGNGFDASEDGTGRGTPLVVTGTLSARTKGGGGLGTDFELAGGLQVTEPMAFNWQSGGTKARVTPQPRTSALGGTQTPAVMLAGTLQAGGKAAGSATNQDAENGLLVPVRAQVRRLLPVETERLQGFADGYTEIAYRGKTADVCPDGPRYRAIGNSWAVPCARWVAAQIVRVS